MGISGVFCFIFWWEASHVKNLRCFRKYCLKVLNWQLDINIWNSGEWFKVETSKWWWLLCVSKMRWRCGQYWVSLTIFMSLKTALFHSFYSWVIFHCIYVLHLLYLFLCRWIFRLLPCLIYISLYNWTCLIKYAVLLLIYSVFSSALYFPFSLKKKKKKGEGREKQKNKGRRERRIKKRRKMKWGREREREGEGEGDGEKERKEGKFWAVLVSWVLVGSSLPNCFQSKSLHIYILLIQTE